MTDRHDDGAGGQAAGIAAVALLAVLAAGAGLTSATEGPVDGPAAPGTGAVVQPGTPLGNATAAVEPLGCTVSYVLDGPDAVYVGVPATCAEEGETLETPERGAFATVEHVSDAASVALASVHTDHEAAVRGEVRGVPGAPTGPAEQADTRSGDLLWTPDGAGVLEHHGRGTAKTVVAGDERPAGTPLVHADTGALLGHPDRVGACLVLPKPSLACGLPPVQMLGPTTTTVLDALAEDGYDVTLRTAEDPDTPHRTAGQAGTTAARQALDRSAVIQPGDPVTTAGGFAFCTFNFAFQGPEDVYLGTAKHCVSQGQRVGTEGFPSVGTATHLGEHLDVALVDIDDEHEPLVVPSIEGHPGAPRGVAAEEETEPGDLVYISGHGTGPHVSEPTREHRWGVQTFQSNTTYAMEGVVSPGDSGGPIVHAPTGQALGIAARIVACVGFPPVPGCHAAPVEHAGPTVEGVLEAFHERGLELELLTVEDGPTVEQAAAQVASTVTSTTTLESG